ncbi:MAG: ABC transporter permease [Chloroflexi bacterium]|nr:ABC transporter permease [Anaerolineaceae bacterium]NMB87966.1 ABC transporter permease [Chloroflexota bacterium]
MIETVLTPDLLAATLRVGTPILLVALGAAITLKAGIFNIAVEGMMLLAAFLGVVLSSQFENIYIGALLTILLTVGYALVYGLITITLKADQIIAGLGLNMFASGLTAWLLQSVLNAPGGYTTPTTPRIPVLSIGFLDQVPVLGTIVNHQHAIVYLSWLLAGVAYLFVHRSKFGLRLRATGEHPLAAATVGINVVQWQYLSLVLCGVLCALAGISLSLASLGLFTKGMTAGRGFIAFAAASFATGNIPGTALISLLFALCSSLAIRLEGFGIPTRFVQMIPYLVTFIALIFARRKQPE